MNLIEERTIALAGVLQACSQVQNLARNGRVDQSDFDASVQSILVLDALNTPSIYGGLNGVRSGLRMIEKGIVSSAAIADAEVLRYAVSILHLQTQLYSDNQKYSAFGAAVDRLSSYSSGDLIDACSEVYQTHISTMRPQIIVQGDSEHLQNATIPPKVRALLLAAFRSAVLWRQKGGNRFKLLWERTRMQNAARDLLRQAVSH